MNKGPILLLVALMYIIQTAGSSYLSRAESRDRDVLRPTASAVSVDRGTLGISESQTFQYTIPHTPPIRPEPAPPVAAAKTPRELIEETIYGALQLYSNVHRGNGMHSRITGMQYAFSRDIVKQYVGLSPEDYEDYYVIFGDKYSLKKLGLAHTRGMDKANVRYHTVSSDDIGLPFGITAVVIHKDFVPEGAPAIPGGGTVLAIISKSPEWESPPLKFEAGTPQIISAIALARALAVIMASKNPDLFKTIPKHLYVDDIFRDDELTGISGRRLLNRLKKTLIKEEGSTHVNLDNAASTPTFEPIWQVARRAFQLRLDQRPALIERVKAVACDFFGADIEKYDAIFDINTSRAIHKLADRMDNKDYGDIEPVVVTSRLEHNSNALPWSLAKGIEEISIDIDKAGFFDNTQLRRLLREYNEEHKHGKKRIILLALSGASNVLGSVNDMKKAAKLAHEFDAEILVDAAQLAPHRAVQMQEWGIDYLAFSAHKIYAPFGSGGLMVRKEASLYSDVKALETPIAEMNIMGIAALGKAMELLKRIGLDIIEAEEKKLTAYALRELKKLKDMIIYGINDPEKIDNRIGVITFNIGPKLDDLVATGIEKSANVGFRSGSLCGDRVFEDGHVDGALRISFGLYNTKQDIDLFVEALEPIAASDKHYGFGPEDGVDYIMLATERGLAMRMLLCNVPTLRLEYLPPVNPAGSRAMAVPSRQQAAQLKHSRTVLTATASAA